MEQELSEIDNCGGKAMILPRGRILMLMMHPMHHGNMKSRPAIQNNHRITSFFEMYRDGRTDRTVRFRGVKICEAALYVKDIMMYDPWKCIGGRSFTEKKKKEDKMTRHEAQALLAAHVKSERMLDHCYASEAVLRALASRLGKDVEKWGLAGLLHDIDIEAVGGDLTRHCCEAEKILEAAGLDPEIVDAVKMHNEAVCGKPRQTEFQHALAAGETVTGLIVATALVYSDKKIASVKVKSITKRMKEKAFAASVNRDRIRECEKIGLSLDEFVEISLGAMRGIADRIGL